MTDLGYVELMLHDAEKALSRFKYRKVTYLLEELQKGREIENKQLLQAIKPSLDKALDAVEDASYNERDINREAGPYQKAQEALGEAKKALRRVKTASSLGKLQQMSPLFRKALQDLYRENRSGNHKIVSAVTEAGKKFNEVLDLLRVIEWEEQQERRER